MNAVKISDVTWLQLCLIDHTAVGIFSDDFEGAVTS
jgi:hypothetical protein